MKTNNEAQLSICEYIYIFSFDIFLIVKLLSHTTFGIPAVVSYVFISSAIVLLVAKLILQNKLSLKTVVFAILAFIVFYISMRHNDEYQLLYSALFIATAKNVRFDKIASSYVVIASTILIFTVVSFALGFIPENSTIRNGIVRHSFGYTYPTDLVALIFYIFVVDLYLTVKNRKSIVLRNFLYVLIACLTFKFCDSRIGSFSILLLVPFSFILSREVHDGKHLEISRFSEFLLQYSFIIFAAISVFLVHALIQNDKNPILVAIDKFSSYRLLNSLMAVKTYGYSLFGQNIYALYQATGNKDWFFIDSSYYIILIEYGTVVFCIVCVAFVWRMRKFIANKMYVIPSIMFLICFNSMLGQQFALLEYNIFLLTLLSEVSENDNSINTYSNNDGMFKLIQFM